GVRSSVWRAVSYQLKDRLKILSGCIPIRGRKRVPYLKISTVLSLVPWLILGLNAQVRVSKGHLLVFLTEQNFGSAMADVVVDAMIAEAVKFERSAFAGDLQSTSWLAMAFGGICGSLFGGYALTNLQIDKIFLLFSILAFLQLLSSFLVEENSTDAKHFQELESSPIGHENTIVSDEDKSLVKKSKSGTSRRKKNPKNSKKYQSITRKTMVPEKHGSLALQWFHSLKMATYSLCRAFKQLMILRWTHVGLALLGLLDIGLVSRSNMRFGVSDKTVVLYRFMPFLILSGQLCPPGIEGTLFALFMSINNLGSTLGSFVGAGLASISNISSGSFDNLLLGVAIQVLCTFIPIAFLFLIPKEATAVST
ncbi:Biopterin transporter family, partial [Dillenia turbinata]